MINSELLISQLIYQRINQYGSLLHTYWSYRCLMDDLTILYPITHQIINYATTNCSWYRCCGHVEVSLSCVCVSQKSQKFAWSELAFIVATTNWAFRDACRASHGTGRGSCKQPLVHESERVEGRSDMPNLAKIQLACLQMAVQCGC